ncbi:MAG: sulfopyruvate decarboxylase subunit alpha [Candidatus Odinarchaeota archaeon]
MMLNDRYTMKVDIILYETIKSSGIDLILSLPCILLKGLLEEIDKRHEIQNIPITREEEGVGIAAGAYLGGKVPAILMQNSGLGNSVNAIKSLLQLYRIPVIFVMSHRGDEGEKILAQIPMGKLTPSLLDLLNIKKFIINSLEDIKNINRAVDLSIKTKNSVGILLKRNLWRK